MKILTGDVSSVIFLTWCGKCSLINTVFTANTWREHTVRGVYYLPTYHGKTRKP